LSAIVISVPGRIWPEWRSGVQALRPIVPGGPQPLWSWRGTAKPPPISAGENVYIAAIDRVQAVGVAQKLVLEERKPPYCGVGQATQAWTLFVRGFEPVFDGPRVRPLSTWRYRFWEGAP
jgi:hypothetical protein